MDDVYTLGFLTFVFLLNNIDKNLLGALSSGIQSDLKISDAEFGWLFTTFQISFVISGIIFGFLADRFNRKNILSIAIFIWSTSTLLMGFCTSYWQILLLRIGLGISESACTPIAVSIISNINPEYKSISISIYNLGIYCGYGFSFLAGFMGNWRNAFIIISIPGIISSFICFLTISEPKRDDYKGTNLNFLQTLKYIILTPSFWLMSFALGCQLFYGLAYTNWLSLFYQRTFQLKPKDIAKWVPWIIPVFGSFSMITGGILGDFMSKKIRHGRLWLIIIVTILVLIPTTTSFLVNYSLISLLCLIPRYFIGEMYNPNATAQFITYSPKPMTSFFFGLYFFIAYLIGSAGPVTIGYLNQFNGENNVRYHLLGSELGLVISIIFYFLTILVSNYDLKRVEEIEKTHLETL